MKQQGKTFKYTRDSDKKIWVTFSPEFWNIVYEILKIYDSKISKEDICFSLDEGTFGATLEFISKDITDVFIDTILLNLRKIQ